MLQLDLAAAVFAVTLAVYGAIGLRWRRRARIRREFLGLVAALDLEPYHAASLKNAATEAAAAELLLDRYVDIDAEGAVWLAGAGHDPGRAPAHPVPAALLEAVRRHDPAPVSLAWIDRSDVPYLEKISTYRGEREVLLPRIPRMPQVREGSPAACCGCSALVLMVVFWAAAAVLLLESRRHGALDWCAAAVTASCLVLLLRADDVAKRGRARTACDDELGERIHRERHPAPAALGEEQRRRVLRSLGDRGRWRGLDASECEDDEGGLDLDEYWYQGPDAYRYVPGDETDPDRVGSPDTPQCRTPQ